MSRPDTAASVLNNKAFFRRQSTFKNWPLDERLSVWIEIVRHTADKYNKYEYVGSESPFALHIGSMLKHALPDYGWSVADDKLQWGLRFHLENFHMPAWSRIMGKLAHGDEYHSLQVAMEQLKAHAVKSPLLLRLDCGQAPSLPGDFDFPSESYHITMDSMVHNLTEIINEARKWKNATLGYVSVKKPLQETAEISHVFQLYEQDLEDLKARVGPKIDCQIDLVAKIHSCLGI